MKKFLVFLFLCFSLFSYCASIRWEIKEKPSIIGNDSIEDVTFVVSAIIEGRGIYNKSLDVDIRPFNTMNIYNSGVTTDISTGLKLEVDGEIKNSYSNDRKYYTATLSKGFDTIVTQEFTFILGGHGIKIVEGHKSF